MGGHLGFLLDCSLIIKCSSNKEKFNDRVMFLSNNLEKSAGVSTQKWPIWGGGFLGG